MKARKYRKDLTQALVFLIPMAFLAVFLLYPMFTTLIRAFMAPADDLAFHGFSLEGFKQFFTSRLYQKSLRNSFVVSISVTALTLLIGVPMGY
ncbi:MAG: iron ABC transporter permease, partial [Sphaerochaetaceae bacterium]|nr:iron ABC transporter permease [Sphaerochaetaceae bacterium]